MRKRLFVGRGRRKLALAAAAFAGLCGCESQPDLDEVLVQQIQPASVPRRPDEIVARAAELRPTDLDELVVLVRFPEFVLDETFTAYLGADGSVYLPGRLLAERLGLTVTSTEAWRLEGYVGRPDRDFSVALQGETATASVRGTTLAIGPGDLYLVDGDDLYLSAQLVETIWPVRITYRGSELEILLEPTGAIPVIDRLRFEQRRRSTLAAERGEPRGVTDLPLRDNPLGLGLPAAELSLDLVRGDLGTAGNYNLTLAGDVFLGSANLSLSGSQDEPLRDVRALFSRELGSFVLEAGDVRLPSVALLRVPTGRGLAVGNDLERRELFATELEGSGPPGWDVELRDPDSGFSAFATTDKNGFWRFDEVPVQSGPNEFLVILYSPVGEIRAERRSFFAGQQILEPGTMVLNGGVVMLEETDAGTTPTGAPNVGIAPRPGLGGQARAMESGGIAGIASLEYGVSDQLTVAGGLVYDASRPDPLAAAIAARTSVFGAGVTLAAGYEEGGFRAQGAANGRLRGLALGGAFAYSRAPEGATLALQVTGSGRVGPVGITGSVAEQRGPRRPTDRTYTLSLSAPVFGLPLSTTLRADNDSLDYVANASLVLLGRLPLRIGVDGTLSAPTPDSDGPQGTTRRPGLVNRLSLDASYAVSETLSIGASLEEDLLTETRSLSLDAAYDFGPLELQAGIADSGTSRELRLGLRTAFGPDPRAGLVPYRLSRPGIAAQATVLARVCVDRNLDGVCGTDEPPIPRARLVGGQAETNDDGVLSQTLGTSAPVIVALDEASLEDPFLVPSNRGFQIRLRAGQTFVTDLAAVPVGDVDALIERDGGQALRGLTIVFTPPIGDPRTARSDRTGRFYLERLPYGQYRLSSGTDGWEVVSPLAVTLDETTPIADLTIRVRETGTAPATLSGPRPRVESAEAGPPVSASGLPPQTQAGAERPLPR